MPKLERFSTPAGIIDFPGAPASQSELGARWSTNVDGFTQQAIAGDPWNATYQSYQTWYVNPLRTDIPAGSPVAQVDYSFLFQTAQSPKAQSPKK